jgi:tetratricopeptide (TPR) repeat protein
MPALASIFLAIALILSVTLGPKIEPYLWGPALLVLGFAGISSAISYFKREGKSLEVPVLLVGTLTLIWFGARAFASPVRDWAIADGLLLAAAAIGFLTMRAIEPSPMARRIFTWGILTLLATSVVVIIIQTHNPYFVPIFRRDSAGWPSGFFRHYSYGAHFLIASSLLLLGASLNGSLPKWERVLIGLVAVAGLGCVYFTRSRGAVVGACGGLAVFTLFFILTGAGAKARWAKPALYSLPLIAVIFVIIFIAGLSSVQSSRSSKADLTGMMDNDIRLHLLDIASSCIATHPMAGGGSRSFSWECFEFWDRKKHGPGGSRPEHVHNEWVQTASDYGLIGVFLLTSLVFVVSAYAVLRAWSPHSDAEIRNMSAHSLRIGGAAALSAIALHANFEGVLRLLPGALMFGISLGAACCGIGSSNLGFLRRFWAGKIAAFLGVAVLPAAWLGCTTYKELWPIEFAKGQESDRQSRAIALSKALSHWPNFWLLRQRATNYQLTAVDETDPNQQEQFHRLAISDYALAAKHHPYDPNNAINQANLYSVLGDDRQAEAMYARAIRLQGGLEPGYRAHYSLATHLFRKGLRQLETGSYTSASEALAQSVDQIETANSETPGYMFGKEGRNLRISIHEALGAALEEMEDEIGAIASYDFAASIPTGQRAHYRAGVLIGRQATRDWMDRRAPEALAKFQLALLRTRMAGRSLPEGVTNEDRTAYLKHLATTIKYLQGAGIVPSESVESK